VVGANPSPSKAIAKEIGPTVPPVGIAILPPKEILYLALHCPVLPLSVIKPLSSLWETDEFPPMTVSVK
jgi:hypothetical protein